ncbi:EF-hand domain-containing protein 1 [Bienertia sinuspersici]
MSKNVEPTKPSSGIWKKSPSGLVETQKSEEIISQQSLKVEKRQEQAVELSNLPPMAPKNDQSSKATNSLRQNAFSSSPYPVQKNQEVASQQSLRVEGTFDEVGELFDLPPMVPKKFQSSKATNPLKHNISSSSHQPSPKQPSFTNQSNQPSSKQQPIDKPEFDDTVDVATIEVIVIRRCRRYYVQFNEFHQPIRKGGQLLVKLIGSIAKQERFCPVGELDWHHINDVLLADMINEIRDRFVIPDGEIYINKILSQKSQEEHYNSIPCGISRDNWRKLAKYWFSEKGQYMSECGKKARASQCHIHISGGKSFANIRADYEDKHGEEMSLVELYEDEDSKAKNDILAETDGSKSRKEVENEVFESLMYGGQPPKWPRGFGFGVVKRNIYVVHGLLRKEERGKVHKRPLDNENVKLTMSENAELVKGNEVLEERLNQKYNAAYVTFKRNAQWETFYRTHRCRSNVVRDVSITPSESKYAPSSSKEP